MQQRSAADPAESLSLDVVRRVDLLCVDFECAWRAGAPRPIEEFLGSADGALVPFLREELVRVELEYRFRRGESPRAEDYLVRFPECAGGLPDWLQRAAAAASVLPALGAPESIVDAAQAVDTSPRGTEARARPLPPVLGEYEVLDRLGGGGMGEVY